MESAWPRTIAASRSLSRRGGSGSRALPPVKPGTLGGETHFKIALAGNGAHANADRALERLGRRLFGVALRLDVRVHCGAFGADGVSSAPR